MNGWRKAVAVFLLTASGVVASAVPAAASAALEPPTCSSHSIDLQQVQASCVNGSRLWGFRVEVYCTYYPTGGLPEYTVLSAWRVTTETIILPCYPDLSVGFVSGEGSVQIRYQPIISG